MLDIENSMLGNTTSAETGKPAQEVLIVILHRCLLKRPNMSNCSMQRGFRYLLVSVIVIVEVQTFPQSVGSKAYALYMGMSSHLKLSVFLQDAPQ